MSTGYALKFVYDACRACSLETNPSHVNGKQICRDISNRFFQKFKKCRFAITEMDYLGYRISAGGLKANIDKVEAITIWRDILENGTQVKQFLGVVNFCRMFIGARFTERARPLVEFTMKNTNFVWEKEHTVAIQQLKAALANYVVLQIAGINKLFTFYSDASDFAIGAALYQDGKTVAY